MIHDLIGRQFGRLTVLKRSGHVFTSGANRRAWLCRCSCGGKKKVDSRSLLSGGTRSCGCLHVENGAIHLNDLTGKRFGRWTVIKRAPNMRSPSPRWLCRCDCGEQHTVQGASLKNGKSSSCGCWNRERQRGTHGHAKRNAKTPEYRSWLAMNRRCSDPNYKFYSYYGGRGIKVCKRWRDSFENFLADVGSQPRSGMTIDRYPNKDGDYKPSNVRWATKRQQAQNRRNPILARDVVAWVRKRNPRINPERFRRN